MQIWRLLATTIACSALVTACTTDDGNSFAIQASSVSPATGPLGGGNQILITGEGFVDDSAGAVFVLVGGQLAPSVSVLSDTELRVTAPAGAAIGAAQIVVANRYGTASLDGYAFNATPTVSAIEPRNGPAAGGNEVTIQGTGFSDNEAGPPVVYFADGRAMTATVTSDTTIVAVVPAGADFSSANVTVSNRNGVSPASRYRYGQVGLVVGTPSAGSMRFSIVDVSTDPVTVTLSPPIYPAIGDDSSTRLTALVGVDGTLIGADSSNKLYDIGTPGSKVEVSSGLGTKMTSLVQHQGSFYATARQANSIFRSDALDKPYTLLAPFSTGSGNSLASDGDNLWLLVNNRLTQIDSETGFEVPDTEHEFAGLSQCPDLVAHDGSLYALCSDQNGHWRLFKLLTDSDTAIPLYSFVGGIPHGMAVLK